MNYSKACSKWENRILRKKKYEKLDYLMCLCKDCHFKIHDSNKTGKFGTGFNSLWNATMYHVLSNNT